jgi:hypothetical protein
MEQIWTGARKDLATAARGGGEMAAVWVRNPSKRRKERLARKPCRGVRPEEEPLRSWLNRFGAFPRHATCLRLQDTYVYLNIVFFFEGSI